MGYPHLEGLEEGQVIYRSNLTCPDFTPSFAHLHSRPMPHSYGHEVLSDWLDKENDSQFAVYKQCGFLTHDEAAILYNIAQRVGGSWLDIGSHTGWSTVHIAAASKFVTAIDPIYGSEEFVSRAKENIRATKLYNVQLLNYTSRAFFHDLIDGVLFDGVMIDGDHCTGEPEHDAEQTEKHLKRSGIIVFHDFVGKPVQDAVQYLMSMGMTAKIYTTPHLMACCWWPGSSSFVPPEHVPEHNLVQFLGSTASVLGRCA